MKVLAKRLTLVPLLLLLGMLAAVWVSSGVAYGGTTFGINSTADGLDNHPGDGECDNGEGVCTLRAAIMEANAWPGADTITLPGGTYVLSIGGTGEDNAALGDLDITDDLTITTRVGVKVIVDGGHLDRVFHIHRQATANISGVTIQNGFPGIDEAGGGILNQGTLNLFEVTVTSNETRVGYRNTDGGGISNGLAQDKYDD